VRPSYAFHEIISEPSPLVPSTGPAKPPTVPTITPAAGGRGMMRFKVEPVDVLRARFPKLEFRHVRIVEDGWDSLVLDLDGEWIVRFPRRREVEQWVEREIALLPELAATLPVAVPYFELVARNGVVCVGYRKLPGSPARAAIGERTGEDLGRFLSALHRFPVEQACAVNVPCFGPAVWQEQFGSLCADFRERVFPLLQAGERERAETVFARVAELDFVPVLIHADLGPEHVLCRDGRVVGVIDWSDARVADAALDLAWCLNGTPPEVADAVAHTYGVDANLRERSLFYHRLGPWYEVVYGLERSQERFIASGIEGVRARLPTQGASAPY
jgi:aminoglycoside phosphotransferase (APT) family kinase protein